MSDVVDHIQERFVAAGLVGEKWGETVRRAGRLVALFRRYYEGDHRMNLSAEMKAMLQIKEGHDKLLEGSDRYNNNYCEMIVDTLTDRLSLDTIEATGPQPPEPQAPDTNTNNVAQGWVDAVSRFNRTDGLQIIVHEAMLRDGVTYVMSEWSDALGMVVFSHEGAFDGAAGVIGVHDRRGESLVAAAKIWFEADVRHVNLYYPDRVEKFVTDEDGEMVQVVNENAMRDGQMAGVPLVPFRNRGGGRSELINVIPLQDSLNSTLISMVMSALLTAFAILFARGWKPPAAITPGMVLRALVAGKDGNTIMTDDPDEARAYAALNESYDLTRIEGGDLEQLHNQADFLIEQISAVSSTPIPGKMGAAASGEALKQLDIRLVGKARRAQVQIGNAWEDLYRLAHRQQTLFATTLPPEVIDWRARWETAEIRDDANIRDLAKLLWEFGFEREALRVLNHSSLLDFSEDKIKQMMAEKNRDAGAAMQALGGIMPGFELFGEGV